MAHAQKPNFVFRRNGWVHLNRRGRQFSRLLADEVCASAVVMLDTPCSEVVWRVLATHSIRQFPLHFPSRASPCAITLQLDSIADRSPPANDDVKTAKQSKKKGVLFEPQSGTRNSKTCLNRNAIVPVLFFRFHRFPFYKGLCFNKTKYKKYDRLGLQWRNNLK